MELMGWEWEQMLHKSSNKKYTIIHGCKSDHLPGGLAKGSPGSSPHAIQKAVLLLKFPLPDKQLGQVLT